MTATRFSSYLQYLPAAFRASTGDGDVFLGRFLKIFEGLLSGGADTMGAGGQPIRGLEEILERFIDALDPAFTPIAQVAGAPLDSPFLSYLASWVALTLDQNWSLE